MALVPIGGGGNNDAYLQLALMNQMTRSAGDIASGLKGHRERQAMGQLLTGKQGPGLGALTQQGAPGMDPTLAGPALGMTQPGGMAQPGYMQTGQLTPQMAQAFMLQGGDPAALASLMPQQMTPYETAQVDIERQKLAQGPGPESGLGKVAADLKLDLSTPEGLAAAQQAMIGSSRAPVTNINMPDQAKLSDIGSFRNQFMGQAENFQKLQNAYGSLRASLENPSAPNDLALTFAYMKILDPPSIVREGEQATVQNTAGVPERVRAAYNNILTGQRLTPEQRQEFATSAHSLFSESARQMEGTQGQYRNIAQNTMPNYNPADIVPDVMAASREWTAPPVPGPAPPVPTATEQAGGLLQTFGDIAKKEWGALTGGGAPAQAAPPSAAPSVPGGAKPPLTPQQLQSMSIDELARYYAQP